MIQNSEIVIFSFVQQWVCWSEAFIYCCIFLHHYIIVPLYASYSVSMEECRAAELILSFSIVLRLE